MLQPRRERWGLPSSKFSPTSNRRLPIFFADDNGQRSGSIVFDMKDTSEIPAVAEPWFQAFNAKISFRPIMNPQDLAKAGPSINAATKRYGN